MEYYKILDGPSLRSLEIALFGDSHNRQQGVKFMAHRDGHDNGPKFDLTCTIQSCERTDSTGEVWNFTGTFLSTLRGLKVRGRFSTQTRTGCLELGTQKELFENYQEFLDTLRVELHDQRKHEDREAEVRVCLGDIIIASVKMAVGFGPGADGGIYAGLEITTTGDIKRP